MSADQPELYDVLGKLAREALARPDVDARKLAERGIRSIPAATLRELAVREVVGIIASIRRAEAKRIEQLAVRTAKPITPPLRRVADPPPPVTEDNWMSIRDPRVSGNRGDRQDFERHMGDQFAVWLRYAKAFHTACGRDSGSSPASALACMTGDVRRGLAPSQFALGDGRRVTWGEATVSEHETRAEMLTGQAAGVAETAARHVAAVKMIREGGVSCLADLGDRKSAAA